MMRNRTFHQLILLHILQCLCEQLITDFQFIGASRIIDFLNQERRGENNE